MTEQDKKPDNPHLFKILSLNGGGVKGMFTISVLAQLEQIIEEKTGLQNIKVGDYFDLITGTSIGGIMALGLAAGHSARYLEARFQEDAPKIFPKSNALCRLIKTLFLPIYSSKPLRESIKNIIGEEIEFKDLRRRVMIPTVSLSSGAPLFLKTPHNPRFTRDSKIKLIDAALATSAAPTYFAPHYCEELSAYLVDGGLVVNNPSYAALREALLEMDTEFPGHGIENVRILNIGTLTQQYAAKPSSFNRWYRKGYWSLWGMGKNLLLTTMSANQSLHTSMLERQLRNCKGSNHYVQLDSIVPAEAANEITLDNASLTALNTLAGQGKQIAHTKYAENEALRSFFSSPAKPFTPFTTRGLHS